MFRYKWYSFIAFVWAALHSYTRLYLGVHFPLDIISGILLGILIGCFCFWLYQKAKVFIPQCDDDLYSEKNTLTKYTRTGFKITNIQLLLYSIAVTLFGIICFAWQVRIFI